MTTCSQEATDATNLWVQIGCCQLEAANPPQDRGRAWPPSTAQTRAPPGASATVTRCRLCPTPAATRILSTTAACTANTNTQAGSRDPVACEDVTATDELSESPDQGLLEFGLRDCSQRWEDF